MLFILTVIGGLLMVVAAGWVMLKPFDEADDTHREEPKSSREPAVSTEAR